MNLPFVLILLASIAFAQLDTGLLEDNTWVNLQAGGTTLPTNGSNWMYENDFKSDPFYGYFLLGPGHVVHPQDCNWYPFDPIKNKWTKLDPPVRPVRQCMSSFCVNSQDTVILQFGGAEASHQLSQGSFDAAYMSIIQGGARGHGMWAYSFNRNEWYHMRGPTVLPGQRFALFPQYDPVHDVALGPAGNGLVAYSFHANAAVNMGNGFTCAPFNYSSAVDTRRGLLYIINATGLWQYNPDTDVWTRMAGMAPGYLAAAPGEDGPGLNMLAYDEVNDILLYVGEDLAYGAPVINTWIFKCDSLIWEKQAPAAAPREPGFLAYNRALNCFMLMGGEAASIVRGAGTTGIWMYRYRRGPGPFADLARAPEANLDVTNGSAALSWPRINEPGVTGYNIYRAPANPFPKNFVKLNSSPVADTFYTDASAVSAASYSYRVCAVKNGAEGRLSRHQYTRPGRVLNTVASVEESTLVKVSWDANPEKGIVGYNIYRTRGAAIYTAPLSSSYTKLNASPVNALEYGDDVDLKDGVARGYVVTAVNAFGVESGVSGECTTFPNPPEFAYTIPVAGKMKMGWQPPRRTKILGINFYRVLGEKQNTAGLLTDTVTTGWDLPPVTGGDGYSLQGKTYLLRAVNLLGQEGFNTDQISPVNSEFGFGVATPAQRFNYASYRTGNVSVEGNLQTTVENPGLTVFPNPFNPVVRILLPQGLEKGASVRIFDLSGKRVADLAGSTAWNAAGCASGVYVVVAEKNGISAKKKIIYSR